MKRLLLALLLLLPSIALADNAGVTNSTAAARFSGQGQFGALSMDLAGQVMCGGSGASSLGKAEDSVATSGDVGVPALGKILEIPVAQAADSDYGNLLLNSLNALFVDTVRRATVTHTQPTVTNTTSFTCLAANTSRRYLLVQNNSGANIMINLNNGTLTGIVPTSTNLGIVLTPGSSYTSSNAVPTAAITCYQSSGGSINTISVVEQ